MFFSNKDTPLLQLQRAHHRNRRSLGGRPSGEHHPKQQLFTTVNVAAALSLTLALQVTLPGENMQSRLAAGVAWG